MFCACFRRGLRGKLPVTFPLRGTTWVNMRLAKRVFIYENTLFLGIFTRCSENQLGLTI